MKKIVYRLLLVVATLLFFASTASAYDGGDAQAQKDAYALAQAQQELQRAQAKADAALKTFELLSKQAAEMKAALDAALAVQYKAGVAWSSFQQNNGSQTQGAAQMSSISIGTTPADLPQEAKDLNAANAQVARLKAQYETLDAAASNALSAASQTHADVTAVQNTVAQAQHTIAVNSSGNNANASRK